MREMQEQKPDHVILVDDDDRQLGTCEKVDAHARGLLHRAVSVLVFDARGRLLLQRRAATKYHSGGLWSNTCCTHPRPGEAVADAAHRRLREEMGFDCPLTEIGSLNYRVPVGNNFVEHEYDHVFTGRYDRDPTPDASEADAWQWADAQRLREDLEQRPHLYTPWLRPIFEEVVDKVA
jgi:isopentenyl-diphosphate Delta-isomerase